MERSEVGLTAGGRRWYLQAIARRPLVSGRRDVTDGGKEARCMEGWIVLRSLKTEGTCEAEEWAADFRRCRRNPIQHRGLLLRRPLNYEIKNPSPTNSRRAINFCDSLCARTWITTCIH
jgi:hypothetical protein